MGIFDKFKDRIGEALHAAPLIKATMLGPRAVGKTSVIASIFNDTKEDIAGTALYFRPQASCAAVINVKKLRLMDVINRRKDFTDKPQTGAIEATNVVSTFDFEMGIKGRAKSVDVSIKDFPGEYLDTHAGEVNAFIAESHIIILAIDTPYLMEEEGMYNEQKNDVAHIISFFRDHPQSISNKLILLVPLKSEKYFHSQTIENVSARVAEVYSELIVFCQRNNIACAVTPIQTLGGVEFDRFVDNDGFGKLTKLAQYRFYGDKPAYQPMFCVQTLYYLLTYVANYYEWSKGQPKGLLDRMKDSVTSFLKDDSDFLHEIKKLSMKVMTDRFGYRILNSNTILNIK